MEPASYQERKTISLMITSTLITLGYVWYVYHYQIGETPITDLALSFWAKTILWLLPVAIVGRIIFFILFVIFNAIISRKPEKDTTDERDKLIELKVSRISSSIFLLGFFIGIGVLAFEYPTYLMFLIVVAFGFIGEQIGYLFQLRYYRRGF